MAALGALVLMAGVFLPWYGVGLTAAGRSALAGHGAASARGQAGTLSAREAFGALSGVVLVAGLLALMDAALGLARRAMSVPDGAGQAVVPLGILAGMCVCYRMAVPPSLGAGLAVSLRAGAWVSLLGCLLVATGGLWPRTLPIISPPEPGAGVPGGGAGVGSALGRLS